MIYSPPAPPIATPAVAFRISRERGSFLTENGVFAVLVAACLAFLGVLALAVAIAA